MGVFIRFVLAMVVGCMVTLFFGHRPGIVAGLLTLCAIPVRMGK